MLLFDIKTTYGHGNGQSLLLAKEITEADFDDEIIFDFSNYDENNPFGNLVLVNTIRKVRRENPTTKMQGIVKGNNDYLSHIGFYQALGINFGKKTGEAKPSKNYVPITELFFDYRFYNTIEETACNLANTFDFDEDLKDFMAILVLWI